MNGKRYTWPDAPGWWNPQGELLLKLEGDRAYIAYWRSPINVKDLKEVCKN